MTIGSFRVAFHKDEYVGIYSADISGLYPFTLSHYGLLTLCVRFAVIVTFDHATLDT